MNDEACTRTSLYPKHKESGAKIVPFGGFLMPLQYKGIIAEHNAVRQGCGIFDTCHMGEFKLSGPSALADLERLLTCDVSGIKLNRCRYGLLCNEKGGVIDDLLVYRKGESDFMLVVNSATQDRDYEWISSHVSADTVTDNVSARMTKIDVQGPGAPALIRDIVREPIEGMKFYSFAGNFFGETEILLSRTGYTGEVGFEVYIEGDEDATLALWDTCIDRGAEPCGLGARDTLRLEMGMPLYGHEMNPERNAGETGFDRPISRDGNFIGSEAVLDETRHKQKLVGILLEGRRAAREGDEILDQDGKVIGEVTSGSYGPSVGRAIALGYVEKGCSDTGRGIIVHSSKRPVSGTLHELPFYSEGTARKKLSRFLDDK
jgi:aminomethyltransferase